MPEEILFESESVQSHTTIADYLRSVADKLDTSKSITLTAGDNSVTLDVPSQATFEVKAERETSKSGGPTELSLELELEWDEGATEEDATLSVE